MRRCLLNLLTALSLLLCVAVCVLWVRSYSGNDLLIWNGPRSSAFVWTAPGVLRLEHTRLFYEDDPPNGDTGFRHEVRRPADVFARVPGTNVYGIDRVFVVTGVRWSQYHHALFLPAWLALALTMVLPAARGWRLMRRHSTPPGHCPRCGYDLRATPDRCPECGTEAAGVG